MYLHYGGNASVSQLIPTAAGVTAGLHAETSALTLGGLYTFAPTILGAHYSVAAFLPYLWVVVTAKVATPLGFVKRTNRSVWPRRLGPRSRHVGLEVR